MRICVVERWRGAWLVRVYARRDDGTMDLEAAVAAPWATAREALLAVLPDRVDHREQRGLKLVDR